MEFTNTFTELINMPVDRRATIAAALDASEDNHGELPSDFVPPTDEGDGTPLVKEPPADEPPPEGEEKPSEPEVKAPPQEKTPETAPSSKSDDKPPQSWRAAQKAKWAGIDPEIKNEIMRRERDHEKVLNESASARQLVSTFGQVIQPYMARIQSFGVHPIVAVNELLKADHLLYSSPMPQRAALMAKLIQDYGVDVVELDKALSGVVNPQQQQQNPQYQIESTLNSLLEERLKPLNQFIQTQAQQEQQRRQQESMAADSTIEQMAADNVKYPHFDSVRQDMADIIEIQSKKGVYLTLEQAYNRAVGMNPEVSQLVAQEQAKSRLQSQHQRAKTALSASRSVNGAPMGAPGLDSANVKDRRATIAAAFDALEGR
jgi:hypothetical protein